MNPAVLAEKVRATAVEVLADRGLDSTVLPETVRLERPRNPAHGDYATSIALQVSRQIGVSSLDLAGWLAEALTAGGEIEDAQVAGPGFLNLRLAAAAQGDIVVDVETAAGRYGHGTLLAGQKIKVEFSRVGLIDVDTARVIATGDAMARVFAAQGAEVSREYVVADDERFVDSLIAAASGESTPDGGYAGVYIADIAAEVLRKQPGALTDRETFRRLGAELMAEQVRAQLQDFRVELGRDLDADETVRLTGSPVSLVKDGRPVLISNRAGNVVTLEDMVEKVGVDATRYALVRTPLDAPVTIDLDLLDARVRPNPVFLVRYAHARISRVVENSAMFGTKFGANVHSADLGLLAHELEGTAIRTLGEFPEVVATAAELREPHRVGRCLEELAGALHRWYDTPECAILPKGDDEVAPVHLARLRLASAVRQVLVNGLEMLGVSAPERM